MKRRLNRVSACKALLCFMAFGLASPTVSAAPVISPTKKDAISNDVNSDTMANPGDTLKYTVTIPNSGDASGTNVQFTDTLDTNTTLVPGSVTVTPIAANDDYSISGNTTLGSMFIDASNGLLVNDSDPDGGGTAGGCTEAGVTCTVTVQTATPTTQGGTVDVNADGSFEYFPEAGNSTTDTFTYMITDADSKTDTGTVSIMFPEVIWYVDNSQAAPGNGTSDSPFNTLAAAASASSAGHMIYVLSGATPSVTGQNSGITLKGGQSLVGQGVALQVMFDGAPVTLFPAGTPPVITNTAGNGVTLVTNNTIKGLNIGNGSNPVIGTGIADNGLPFGTLTVSSVMVTTTGPTLDLDVAGTLATTFGSLSSSNSTGRGLRLSNLGGTFTVSGPTTISGPATEGVLLSSNTGGTFNFAGMNITNTGNTGFSASSGGTVNVTGSANTIATTTGTALNLTNTTIGASGITFRSISASGGTNGIVLNNTGTSGGFTVTGTGTAGSGGTIQNTTGDGVSLTSASSVSLSFMNVNSNLGNGIRGNNVTGFTLASSVVNNNGNDAVTDESGLHFTNLLGTASITSTTISNNFEFQLQITNSTGTLTNLQMAGNTISSTGASGTIGNLFNFLGAGGGTGNMTLNVTSGTFTGNAPATATGVQCDHSGTSGTMTCNISGATFTNNNVGPQGSVAGNANVIVDFNGNNIQGSRSHAVNIFADANSPFTKTITGRIRNNIIGTAGVTGSASTLGFPIRVQNEGRVPVTLAITGNTINESVNFTGINVNHGISTTAGTGATNVTITGNSVNNIDSGRGVLVQQVDHATAGLNAGTLCADIGGNTFTNIVGQAGDGTIIRVDEASNNSAGPLNVRQLAPTAAVNANELDDANGVTVAQISLSNSPTFNAGACTQP